MHYRNWEFVQTATDLGLDEVYCTLLSIDKKYARFIGQENPSVKVLQENCRPNSKKCILPSVTKGPAIKLLTDEHTRLSKLFPMLPTCTLLPNCQTWRGKMSYALPIPQFVSPQYGLRWYYGLFEEAWFRIYYGAVFHGSAFGNYISIFLGQ